MDAYVHLCGEGDDDPEGDVDAAIEASAVGDISLEPPEFLPGWAQMEFGLPRPRTPDGRLPVPYIAASASELGEVDPHRQYLCLIDKRCQVCGQRFDAKVLLTGSAGHTIAMDGAGVHPGACWDLALAHCPQLRKLARRGELIIWVVDVEQLRLHQAESQLDRIVTGYALPLITKGELVNLMTDPDSVLCTACEGAGTNTWTEQTNPGSRTVVVRCEPCRGTGRHAPLPPCPAEHPDGRGTCMRRDRHTAHKTERPRTGATYRATDVWIWSP